MPKARKASGGHKAKVYAVPSAQKKRDIGIPKIQTSKLVGRQAMPYGKSKPTANAPGGPSARTIPSLASTSQHTLDTAPTSLLSSLAGPSTPLDPSLTTRDSSSKAFMRELRKVIERSDVIIQVLDARDPEGTRSKWVEEEVRKREGEGKKLLAVMNKIDLVPRSNLDAWMKYLRHSFPTMPFKSSTQSQRHNLSQNAVPLAPTAPSIPGQAAPALPALPVTSSSLGAPALLHLLKQYSLSTPHSSLTVGVVGYPNVGKSSLINSLKRSRACGVAAMPGKTRVVQEVVLDKGVKMIDCPGVVLEDVTRLGDGPEGEEEGRRKRAEIMLRNCIKAELVDDPISPVEVILSKVDPLLLEKQYNIPSFADVRDFLIKIALTRGRLGKGGIPDLEGSAVSVLRDWNSGKIPYSTVPPAVHPSSAPPPGTLGGDDVEMEGNQVGDAKILNTLSEAFTLEGLLDGADDEAAWEGEDAAGEEGMLEDDDLADDEHVSGVEQESVLSSGPSQSFRTPTDFLPPPLSAAASTTLSRSTTTTLPLQPRHPSTQDTRLFTPDELSTLPPTLFDRQKAKQAAKKAKKRRAAAEETEGELMLGFMGMGVEEPQPVDVGEGDVGGMMSARRMKKEKKRAKVIREKELQRVERLRSEREVDEEAKREMEFESFLKNMGEDEEL